MTALKPSPTSSSAAPTIVWLRKDLRLADNHALTAAATVGPVIPVFILDDVFETTLGAAAKLRLKLSLEALSRDLAQVGAPLILRRGDVLNVLRALITETGAKAVTWTRLTDGAALERDKRVKAALTGDGVDAESHGGFTLVDPWTVKTGAGNQFKVYTPFWRAVSIRDIERPLPRLKSITGVEGIRSETLADWRLDAEMGPATNALASQITAGEQAALDQLDAFLDGPAPRYADDRDQMGLPNAVTQLSDHLAVGEISPRTVWWALKATGDTPGHEAARKQIVWRDFAHHLLFHDPEMETQCWRREWEDFAWADENDAARKWKAGRTGIDVVDAAMRQLWVTGRMHNRARMIVASVLTKNLLVDWRVGEAWFRHTLIDWDPANNAMGWQWVAGCGPDASPFFRIFNPATQAEKFDKSKTYRRRWLYQGEGAKSFKAMWPKSDVTLSLETPPLMVDLATTRRAALAAWEDMKQRRDEKASIEESA
ncbi:MAG: deoxyribodipyrimidine photo-lyase [Paracoccaceae bacterium]|nr:deoxyribodipyrimidine photo-lyase [Paracoccaceae bacterium]MDG1371707.1 deoxyribodipyrimidine photo-lyase [Paracoccaceae bacterium]